MESSRSPMAGLYKTNALQAIYYGPDTVKQNLLSCLPSENSKAFIVTGSSLYNSTPLIKDLETLLAKRHAGTFSNIKQHAPVAQLDEATDQVLKDPSIDTIISVGGGSPIDSAKAISYRVNEKSDHFLRHVAIPTTLSAAECTFLAGYTQSDGVKTGIAHPSTLPSHVLYDPKFGLHTPPHLFITTGIRALDHAVELQYHPTATWMPCQLLARTAVKELFDLLPQYKSNPKDEDIITRLFLAAYASLGFLGGNIKGGLGLSHTLGYALGSPYGIPHGVTSCLTLGHVVKLKAKASKEDAVKIAELLPVLGQQRSKDDVADAEKVGDLILKLVDDLGYKTTLTEKGVEKSELETIVGRATGGKNQKGDDKTSSEEDQMVKGVRKLVEALW